MATHLNLSIGVISIVIISLISNCLLNLLANFCPAKGAEQLAQRKQDLEKNLKT